MFIIITEDTEHTHVFIIITEDTEHTHVIINNNRGLAIIEGWRGLAIERVGKRESFFARAYVGK